jgi:hypothetical protein
MNTVFASEGQSVVATVMVTVLLVGAALIAWRLRRLSRGDSNPLERSRTLATDRPPEEAIQIFSNAMTEMGVSLYTAPSSENRSSVLEGKKGMTLRSAGQRIRVVLIESGEDSSHWAVSSWPSLQTTVTDWGESSRVVEQLVHLVEKADPTIRVLANHTSAREDD